MTNKRNADYQIKLERELEWYDNYREIVRNRNSSLDKEAFALANEKSVKIITETDKFKKDN